MQSPTVVCSLCKREGHLKRDCPEDFKKIELDPLPPLTPKFSVILDQVCVQCYRKFFSFAYYCGEEKRKTTAKTNGITRGYYYKDIRVYLPHWLQYDYIL